MEGVSHYIESMFEIRVTNLGVLFGKAKGGHAYLKFSEVLELKNVIDKLHGQLCERLGSDRLYSVGLKLGDLVKREYELAGKPISMHYKVGSDMVLFIIDRPGVVSMNFKNSKLQETLTWDCFFANIPSAISELEKEVANPHHFSEIDDDVLKNSGVNLNKLLEDVEVLSPQDLEIVAEKCLEELRVYGSNKKLLYLRGVTEGLLREIET